MHTGCIRTCVRKQQGILHLKDEEEEILRLVQFSDPQRQAENIKQQLQWTDKTKICPRKS